jgi:hypothetical protein
VVFCIRMSVIFNQYNSERELTRLLLLQNETIRKEVIEAIGEMMFTNDTVDLLMIIEQNAPLDIKLKIINAIGKIPNEKVLKLLQIWLYNDDFSIAFEAGKALKNVGKVGIELLKYATKEPAYPTAKNIATHMLEEQLNDA